MPLTAPIFVQVVLSDLPCDIELVGGPSEAMRDILVAMENKGLEYRHLNEAEARVGLIAQGSNVGCGFFIEDGANLLEDEKRRYEAYQLLVYLSTRLGMGTIYHPVALSSTGSFKYKQKIYSKTN